MMYVSDVPDRVALNEALEITKKYSDEKSRKFVNGVLVAQQLLTQCPSKYEPPKPKEEGASAVSSSETQPKEY